MESVRPATWALDSLVVAATNVAISIDVAAAPITSAAVVSIARLSSVTTTTGAATTITSGRPCNCSCCLVSSNSSGVLQPLNSSNSTSRNTKPPFDWIHPDSWLVEHKGSQRIYWSIFVKCSIRQLWRGILSPFDCSNAIWSIAWTQRRLR